MLRLRLVRFWPLAAAALALAACAPAGGSAAGAAPKGGGSAAPTEVYVVATDFKFDPPLIRLPAGKPVTLVFDNKGSVEHDLHVAALSIHIHANAGQGAKATVTADKGGAFDLDCTIPGHRELGMKGSMVVAAQ
ncbi:MAG: hypothetical protein EPO26_15465 [Chloroflexota bacterium]|nr:MAG: hypothetical protein EPO26_15465 [Chloroflexota bacterium]